MNGDPPLILVHYGPSTYLRYTLRAARRSNPGKKIFFLGDETNRRFCPSSVEFLPWRDLARGSKLEKFRSVFEPIEGARHRFSKHGGTKRWLAFVFERWFFLENLVEQIGLSRFWTFDSDTMVAGDLSIREHRFAEYQATEQCRGHCLNGLINDASVVRAYTDFMIGLFESETFLQQQRDRLRVHEGLCFNEMDAWQHFRDTERVSTFHLGRVCQAEMFDDAIAITKGFETAEEKVNGRAPVKRILLDARGGAFAFPLGDPPVRLVTLNLSWMPNFIFSRILRVCRPTGELIFDRSWCAELGLRAPLLSRLAGWNSRN